MKKRDTYVYDLKNGNTIVYYGISNDLKEKEEQHQRTSKDFSDMRKITNPMYRENAKKKETEFIQRYQRQHGGEPPEYNKNKIY